MSGKLLEDHYAFKLFITLFINTTVVIKKNPTKAHFEWMRSTPLQEEEKLGRFYYHAEYIVDFCQVVTGRMCVSPKWCSQ